MDDRMRILMAAYPFPPYQWVGGASIRLVKFLKYIARLRPLWRVDLLTAGYGADEGNMPQRSADLLAQVPESVRVIRLNDPAYDPASPEPAMSRAVRFGRKVAGRLMRPLSRRLAERLRPMDPMTPELIPDAHVSWNAAVEAWLDAVPASEYDLVYASSPPYSTAVLGRTIKAKLDVPLVVDIKDNWLTGRKRYDADRVAVEDAMERSVIEAADRVILVTPGALAHYRRHYSEFDHFQLITNGVDLEDYAGLVAPAERQFKITYAGSLGGENRSPANFFKAYRRLLDDSDVRAKSCVACFPEHMKPAFWAVVEQLDLTGRVKPSEVLPAEQFRSHLAESEVLLSINYYNETTLVPGKLYEYWAAGRPVFLIEKPGAATDLVQTHGLGRTADPDDVNGIYRALRAFYDGYAAGGNPAPPRAGLEAFSREALSEQLCATFEQLIEAHRSLASAKC